MSHFTLDQMLEKSRAVNALERLGRAEAALALRTRERDAWETCASRDSIVLAEAVELLWELDDGISLHRVPLAASRKKLKAFLAAQEDSS